MMILPRFLYILQNTTFHLPGGWFRDFDGALIRFLWGHGIPRIALAHCRIPPYDGSMGVTNLHLYYLATRLLVVHDWYTGGWSDPAYQTELRYMDFPQLHAYLYGAPIPQALPPNQSWWHGAPPFGTPTGVGNLPNKHPCGRVPGSKRLLPLRAYGPGTALGSPSSETFG